MYNIERVCWNEKTFNGYTDSPYWLISLEGKTSQFGLADNGQVWVIYKVGNEPDVITSPVQDAIERVIRECSLKIKINLEF
jgi:hypothetical protein